MKEYKIEVFVPINSLDNLVDEIRKLEIGMIGEYKNCMNWYKVNSYWEASENANPYLGVKGKSYNTEEYKLEFRCREIELKSVIECIRKCHPYEEICINIIELLNIYNF